MVARGYGAVYEKAQLLRTQALLALGTLALLGGWLLWLFVLLQRGIAMAVMLVGAWNRARCGVAGWAGRYPYRLQAPPMDRSRYVGGAGLRVSISVILLLPLPFNRNTLYYSPFPSLSWPEG